MLGAQTDKIDKSLREQYREERILRILRITKYSCPFYIVIVGFIFTYTDIYISKVPFAPFWRAPSVFLAIVVLYFIHSRFRDNYKLIYVSYATFLFLISFMMAGLTWVLFDSHNLNRTFSGILLAIFVIYIGSLGGYRVLIFVYLPLIILPVLIYLSYHPPTLTIIQYGNPIALMIACLIASQVDENLRFKEFSSRKIAENEKNKANKAFSELKSTQTQLIHSEKMASLGELTAGIAHEIQNPLNFVNNFAELSVDMMDEIKEEIKTGSQEEADEISGDLKENLSKIVHHGKRASSIVKSMLEHSRIGDGVKEFTNINALADEYLRLAYHGMRAKDKSFNADFKTEFDKTIPKINVVPHDIGRVLLNLINNAFYACTERSRSAVSERAKDENGEYTPTVVVTTKGTKEMIEITVKDNGPGIPEDIKDKIFQPFFTTKATGEGTGLGLSLSYDIITKGHGGTIEVKSKERIGTEFLINLPLK